MAPEQAKPNHFYTGQNQFLPCRTPFCFSTQRCKAWWNLVAMKTAESARRTFLFLLSLHLTLLPRQQLHPTWGEHNFLIAIYQNAEKLNLHVARGSPVLSYRRRTQSCQTAAGWVWAGGCIPQDTGMHCPLGTTSLHHGLCAWLEHLSGTKWDSRNDFQTASMHQRRTHNSKRQFLSSWHGRLK